MQSNERQGYEHKRPASPAILPGCEEQSHSAVRLAIWNWIPPSLPCPQLDKLRTVIENMMASSSTLLSMSMPPAPEPGVAQMQGTCAACSLDVSEKVSQLFKRYEQLQDSINNFMLRQAEGKQAKKPKQRQVRQTQKLGSICWQMHNWSRIHTFVSQLSM